MTAADPLHHHTDLHPDEHSRPSIPAGHDTVMLGISSDGETVYVADYSSNTVTPVITTTNKADHPIRVARHPYFVLGAPQPANMAMPPLH